MSAGLIQLKNKQEFLLFDGFLSVTPTLLFSPFSCTKFKENNKTKKTKGTVFSNHDFKARKKIFAFLFHPHTVMYCLSYSCTQLEGNKREDQNYRFFSKRQDIPTTVSLPPTHSYVPSLMLPAQRL